MGCLWLSTAALAGASTGPEILCLQGCTGPGGGLLAELICCKGAQQSAQAPLPALSLICMSGCGWVVIPRLLSGKAPIPGPPQDDLPRAPSLKDFSGNLLQTFQDCAPRQETWRHRAQSDAFCTFWSLGYPRPSPLLSPLPSGLVLSSMRQLPSHSPGVSSLL